MRLLFINPNTSAHLTELGARVARSVARPETEIAPATGRFGARYIASRAAAAVAAYAVLDIYAREGRNADAVVIACFGDPGLFALRELARCRSSAWLKPPAIWPLRWGGNSPSSRAGIVGERCWRNSWPPSA